MGKQLYRVKVILYVMAENESEARVAATNSQFDIFECTARKAEHIDSGWENAIPYNADNDRTCAEILASQQPRTNSAKTFPSSSRKQGTSLVPYMRL